MTYSKINLSFFKSQFRKYNACLSSRLYLLFLKFRYLLKWATQGKKVCQILILRYTCWSWANCIFRYSFHLVYWLEIGLINRPEADVTLLIEYCQIDVRLCNLFICMQRQHHISGTTEPLTCQTCIYPFVVHKMNSEGKHFKLLCHFSICTGSTDTSIDWKEEKRLRQVSVQSS